MIRNLFKPMYFIYPRPVLSFDIYKTDMAIDSSDKYINISTLANPNIKVTLS